MAFHLEKFQDKPKFLKPVVDKVPDSIKLKDIMVVVLLSLFIQSVAVFVLVLEQNKHLFLIRSNTEKFSIWKPIKASFWKSISKIMVTPYFVYQYFRTVLFRTYCAVKNIWNFVYATIFQ